jgi:hypothetical protein
MPRSRMVELYFCPPIFLHDIAFKELINQLRKRPILPLKGKGHLTKFLGHHHSTVTNLTISNVKKMMTKRACFLSHNSLKKLKS